MIKAKQLADRLPQDLLPKTKSCAALLSAVSQLKTERNNLACEIEELLKPNVISPAKGEPMPQTREYWEKRAMLDQELILEQKSEISKLKHRVNKLEQGR